ncbi:6-carboxytetrahydropterin synthase QueD [Desulfonatronospira sp.]|uniref:6-carboxytetrahydropterin synthase QueD n=1 Tax=Desulfonatronospira sp. TaxID=1962951 RepID=UPI0025BA226D|nr:6-carboxytetrahydropterin synthase QueD [Desulfonatronospira sp.]
MAEPKYCLRVRSDFSSSHQLRNYGGKCESLHGHNFQVQVQVCGKKIDPDTGMLMDFKELKNSLQAVLEELDHKHLNDLPHFKVSNPSSENLACFVFQGLKARLMNRGVTLDWVMVAEKDSSRAYYSEP